jgi:ubiquinone/menaquinone biosynthesis C-methylase UbiE
VKRKMMAKPRVVETNHGIVGKEIAKAYDISMRHLRDKGRLQTDSILKSRIDLGSVLEIGPGPGYEGLEWLNKTEDTTLKGLDISKEMTALAMKNAQDYELTDRAKYFLGDASSIPFEDGYFDAVFSTNSLHEWALPMQTFDEIHRVLRPGGRYFISDLRRDQLCKCRLYFVGDTEDAGKNQVAGLEGRAETILYYHLREKGI